MSIPYACMSTLFRDRYISIVIAGDFHRLKFSTILIYRGGWTGYSVHIPKSHSYISQDVGICTLYSIQPTSV